MKYVKYSNVSRDDLILFTDSEFDSAWDCWNGGKSVTLARLGIVLPKSPTLPCGTPHMLRGHDYLYLTSGDPSHVASLRDGRLFFLMGNGSLGTFADAKDSADWRGQDIENMDAREVAARYGFVNIDDAVSENRLNDFHVRCIFG